MSNPKRSKRKDAIGVNPAPTEIAKFREARGLSQTAAAGLAFSSLRTWQNWESGERRMHPAIWAWVQVAERETP